MSDIHRYFFSVDDLARARGSEASLSFDGASPEALARAVEDALRSDQLFHRWRALQPDPDEVDDSLGATDPTAHASAELSHARTELELSTTLPMRIVRQRLNWLIGAHWQLRDMR